jgi:hypothetical protein
MAVLRIRITLMRIRIQLVTLIRIRILASKKGSKPRKSAQIGSIPYIFACHLQIDADPYPDGDPGPQHCHMVPVPITDTVEVCNTGIGV